MTAARLRAILRQRCPVCLEGRMFRGVFTMNAACSACGHRFERETGFFQGAMYVSYALGIGEAVVLVLVAMFVAAPLIGGRPRRVRAPAVPLFPRHLGSPQYRHARRGRSRSPRRRESARRTTVSVGIALGCIT